MTHLEDYSIGDRYDLGRYTFEAEAIKRFARAFDPQPFHINEKDAAESQFGALCASGWHTAAIWMKLMAAHHQRVIGEHQAAGHPIGQYGPSPGFEDLRWLKPVFAGDTIMYTCEVKNVRQLRSQPNWGMVSTYNEGRGEDGTAVFSLTIHFMAPNRSGEV